jgi:hypothetical protein
LNIHAPTEDKIHDVKDSFYDEMECVFDKVPKHRMKILLGDFNAKVGREDIFKLTIGNESLHEINNDNGFRVVNLLHLKTSESKVCFHITTTINILRGGPCEHSDEPSGSIKCWEVFE